MFSVLDPKMLFSVFLAVSGILFFYYLYDQYNKWKYQQKAAELGYFLFTSRQRKRIAMENLKSRCHKPEQLLTPIKQPGMEPRVVRSGLYPRSSKPGLSVPSPFKNTVEHSENIPLKTHVSQFRASQKYAPSTPSPLSMSPMAQRKAFSVRQPSDYTGTLFTPVEKTRSSDYSELKAMAVQSPFAKEDSQKSTLEKEDLNGELDSVMEETPALIPGRKRLILDDDFYKLEDPNSSTPRGTNTCTSRVLKKLRKTTPKPKVVDAACSTAEEVPENSPKVRTKRAFTVMSDDEDESVALEIPTSMRPEDGWITPQSRKMGKRARFTKEDEQSAKIALKKVFLYLLLIHGEDRTNYVKPTRIEMTPSSKYDPLKYLKVPKQVLRKPLDEDTIDALTVKKLKEADEKAKKAQTEVKKHVKFADTLSEQRKEPISVTNRTELEQSLLTAKKAALGEQEVEGRKNEVATEVKDVPKTTGISLGTLPEKTPESASGESKTEPPKALFAFGQKPAENSQTAPAAKTDAEPKVQFTLAAKADSTSTITAPSSLNSQEKAQAEPKIPAMFNFGAKAAEKTTEAPKTISTPSFTKQPENASAPTSNLFTFGVKKPTAGDVSTTDKNAPAPGTTQAPTFSFGAKKPEDSVPKQDTTSAISASPFSFESKKPDEAAAAKPFAATPFSFESKKADHSATKPPSSTILGQTAATNNQTVAPPATTSTNLFSFGVAAQPLASTQQASIPTASGAFSFSSATTTPSFTSATTAPSFPSTTTAPSFSFGTAPQTSTSSFNFSQPTAPKPEEKPATTFGASQPPSFSFGSNNATTTTATNKPQGFVFGAASAPEPAKPQEFAFSGQSNRMETSTNAPGFTFGAPAPVAEPPKQQGFTFGAPNNTSAASPAFGSTPFGQSNPSGGFNQTQPAGLQAAGTPFGQAAPAPSPFGATSTSTFGQAQGGFGQTAATGQQQSTGFDFKAPSAQGFTFGAGNFGQQPAQPSNPPAFAFGQNQAPTFNAPSPNTLNQPNSFTFNAPTAQPSGTFSFGSNTAPPSFGTAEQPPSNIQGRKLAQPKRFLKRGGGRR